MGERRHPTSRLRFYTTVIVAGVVFFTLVSSPFVIPVVNDVTAEPLVCTVESTEMDISSGGPRSATKYQALFTYTSDCGMVYISRLRGSEFKSFEELEQWMNDHRGQQVTFWAGKVQLSMNSTRAERVERY